MLDLNQQSIEPKAGDAVYAPYPARTFKLDNSLSAAVGATTPCKLAGVASNGMPVITPITATSDVVYCVLARNLRTDSFGAGDHVKAWIAGEVIWLKSAAAITAGAAVSANVNGTVQAASGTPVLGFAESSAAGAGELVAINITSPLMIGSASDLSGFLTTAAAAETYLSKADAATDYQAKLTAGDFVDITNNTITTTYSAGTGIAISDAGVISAD